MSQHYDPVSESSGDEDKLVIVEEEAPKKIRKRRLPVLESDEEKEVAPPLPPKTRKAVCPTPPTTTDSPPKKAARKTKHIAVNPEEILKRNKTWRSTLSSDEQKWQGAMDIALKLLTAQKVSLNDFTLLPDAGTLEAFRRCVQGYLNEKKLFMPLIFTTHKSMVTMIARFIMDFVLKSAGLSTPSWNPTGVAIWKHGCEEALKCLHGLHMINKEQIVEMDVGSENAQRALKDNPTGTKVVPNRWGRNVVQIKNSSAMACVCDASTAPNNFSNLSCGMFYTDGDKTLDAFKQAMAYMKASYPKMQNAGSHLLFPINCDCTWGCNQVPLLGRQTCKVTPFSINSVNGIDKNQVNDPKVLATLNHPSMLVYQCYNPVYRNSKGNAQKNCDFKISHVDLVSALQIAKKMWMEIIEKPAPIMLPEWKWDTKYQVQNTILPTGQDDTDDSLF